MSDAELLAPDTGLPPIPLLANSYSLPDLMKASDHVVELKTERGREENMANMAEKLALNQDVLAGLTQPALPPEHILRNVEDSSGTVVRAAMPIIEGGFDAPEPDRDPNAGISDAGAQDEDLPPREDPVDPVEPAVSAVADEPPADDPEPAPAPKPRRKRSTATND